jgi:glycosyltransferase involved in cell wall biosynthesis
VSTLTATQPEQTTSLTAPNLAVIILSYNEELNLDQALRSVCGWAREVFVLDSFSKDVTERIAQTHNCQFVQHAFRDYASQRNWALENLPIASDWIMFLDADEWPSPELKQGIEQTLAGESQFDGYEINRRFIWMGRWIKHGYYPVWILRVCRRGKGRYDAREINEHMVVDGPIGRLQGDLMHEDRRSLSFFIDKHNRYSDAESLELFRATSDQNGYVKLDPFGSSAERNRWKRYRIYNRFPPLLRPVLFFIYRYIFKLGFLDGMAGFTFHFLHGLWYPMLIDMKYLEKKRAARDTSD